MKFIDHATVSLSLELECIGCGATVEFRSDVDNACAFMDPLEILLKIPRHPEPPRPRVRIPPDVRANALIALAVRATMPPSRQGMTRVGLTTAARLATRVFMSVDKVKHIARYFPRHEVDKSAPGWREWSPGRQAWMGWGGDEGWAWAADEASWEVEM